MTGSSDDETIRPATFGRTRSFGVSRTIARRHEISGLAGLRLAVVVYDDGERDIVILTDDDDEPAATLRFTEDQARLLATVLSLPSTGRSL